MRVVDFASCRGGGGGEFFTSDRCLRSGPADADWRLPDVFDRMLSRSVRSWGEERKKNVVVCVGKSLSHWHEEVQIRHRWSGRLSGSGAALPDLEARRPWHHICVPAGDRQCWRTRLCVEALEKPMKSCYRCQEIDFIFSICNLWWMGLSYSAFFGQSHPHWAHTPPWSPRWWRRLTSTTQQSCLTWFLSPILKCLPTEAAGSSLPLIFPLGRGRNVSVQIFTCTEGKCSFISLTRTIGSGEIKPCDLSASVPQDADQLTLIREAWPQPTNGVGVDVTGDGGFPPGLHRIFLQQRWIE